MNMELDTLVVESLQYLENMLVIQIIVQILAYSYLAHSYINLHSSSQFVIWDLAWLDNSME